MNTEQQQTISRLEAEWPRWQVWVVNKVVGGPTWCARLWDNERPVLNADSPDELEEYLAEDRADQGSGRVVPDF